MTATIDGITYEGTPAEIREFVENPPMRRNQRCNWDDDPWSIPPVRFPNETPSWPCDRNWDGSPRITCEYGL